ncbi:MAG TPA: hypothetical protein VD906_02465 [Caulobacteraceae bacterium]|nr:hypothetical protein [Caulobacteraceae bacterium]
MNRIAPTLLALALASPAMAQEHEHHTHESHAVDVEDMKPLAQPPGEIQAKGQLDGHAGHVGHDDAIIMPGPMVSSLGVHPMTRDGSGTSWIPDASPMSGLHGHTGGWTTMLHAQLVGAYTDQGGPRGGEKAFFGGMIGGMASRPLGPGTLGLRAMVSPEPFMGKSGYPLLLAAGETADGEHVLIDRQHPHDLFMELSASYSVPVGEKGSVFIYGGLPGEPAFGPPAYMHRPSGKDAVEAPITHHWLDSTHVVFGVVTAGFTVDRFKVDASAFRGREPDEKRFDIETGELDSRSVRLSFNPTENWALQTSWASIVSPEALEPDQDERRLSASAMYARQVGDGVVSATVALARKDKVPGEVLEAALVEAAWSPNDAWTLFGRAEQAENDELLHDHGGAHHGEAYTVRKVSLGAIRDFRVAESVKLGIGAQVSAFDIEEPLGATYGDPTAGTVFVRLKIG